MLKWLKDEGISEKDIRRAWAFAIPVAFFSWVFFILIITLLTPIPNK